MFKIPSLLILFILSFPVFGAADLTHPNCEIFIQKENLEQILSYRNSKFKKEVDHLIEDLREKYTFVTVSPALNRKFEVTLGTSEENKLHLQLAIEKHFLGDKLVPTLRDLSYSKKGEVVAEKLISKFPKCQKTDYHQKQIELWRQFRILLEAKKVDEAKVLVRTGGLSPSGVKESSTSLLSTLDYVLIYLKDPIARGSFLQFMFDQGANPNFRDSEKSAPVFFECREDLNCLKIFARNGAKLDFDHISSWGSLVHSAFYRNDLATIQFLEEQGVSFNLLDEHESNFAIAMLGRFSSASLKKIDLISYLKKYKIDLNYEDKLGQTILSVALGRDFWTEEAEEKKLIDYLISQKAKLGTCDKVEVPATWSSCGGFENHILDYEWIPHLVDQGILIKKEKLPGLLDYDIEDGEHLEVANTLRALFNSKVINGDLVFPDNKMSLAAAAVIVDDLDFFDRAVKAGSAVGKDSQNVSRFAFSHYIDSSSTLFLAMMYQRYHFFVPILVNTSVDHEPDIAILRAIYMHSPENLNALFSSGVKPEGTKKDACLFEEAIGTTERTSVNLVDPFLDHGLDIKLTCNDRYRGKTTLAMAINLPETFKKLLSMGFPRELFQEAILLIAQEKKSTELYEILEQYHADFGQFTIEDSSGRWSRNALLNAARNGNNNLVDFLLAKNVPLVDVNNPGKTYSPISYAAKNKQWKIVETLLKTSLSPRYSGGTCSALFWALEHKEKQMAETLASFGAPDDLKSTSCYYVRTAVDFGSPEILDSLLSWKAPAYAKESGAVHAATFDLSGKLMEVLVKYSDSNSIRLDETFDWYNNSSWYTNRWPTPLYLAAKNSNIKAAKLLIAERVDIDGNSNRPPLFAAACKGSRELISLLLEHKASLDTSESWSRPTLPFAEAAACGNLDFLDLALKYGQDINKVSSDYGPALAYATIEGKLKSIKFLEEHGANFSFEAWRESSDYKWGKTTLMHLAAVSGNTETILYYLAKLYPADVFDQFQSTAVLVYLINVRRKPLEKVPTAEILKVLEAMKKTSGNILTVSAGQEPLIDQVSYFWDRPDKAQILEYLQQ